MKELLNERFKVYGKQPKLSESGKPIYYANPFIIKGRIEQTDLLLKKPNGEEVKVDGILYTMPNPVIRLNSKIETNNGDEYQVMTVEKAADERAVHHFESKLKLIKYADKMA